MQSSLSWVREGRAKLELSSFVLLQRLLAFFSCGPVYCNHQEILYKNTHVLEKPQKSWLFRLGSGLVSWKTPHLIPTYRQAWEVLGVACWEWKGEGTTFASDCFLATVLYDGGCSKHRWLSILYGLKSTINRKIPSDILWNSPWSL